MAEQIVGRRGELVALGEFLDAVHAGGAALLFEGDAGIGKTALWQEGTRLARDRNVRILGARATHSELRTAFTTIADLFTPVLDETLPRLVRVQRRALEIAFLLREADGPPPERRLLATALLSLVRILVEDRPLVVAIDDAQWVDASSADVLRFVFHRLEGERAGVLATVRGHPIEAPFELDRAFAEFRRVRLAPLSVGATHRLLWGRLSLTLSRPALVRVYGASGGNPFFALEVGRALLDGTIHADGVHVLLPESLRTLVAERLSALPSRVRGTLVAVAALGAPSITLLAPLAPTTLDDIELACQRRMLELDEDRIRFTHPLLAPVCYEDMPLHRRRRLHRRLADLDLDPEERARHLAIAADGPDEEIAVELDAAAKHARGRGAVQAAAELADRAVALTPLDAIDRINRRRITAAEEWFFAGDGKKATALLENAAASSTPGPMRADALCALALVTSATDGKRAAAAVYESALGEPGLEARQQALILCELACLATSRGDNREGARLAAAGLAFAEQPAEPEMLVLSLVTMAEITFWRTGRMQRELLERASAIEAASGGERRARRPRVSLVVDGSPLTTLAWQLGRSGRHGEARTLWRQQIADAYARADPGVGSRLVYLARMEVASGDWEEAARLCAEGIEVGRETGREMIEQLCRMILAELAALKGEVEQARREIPELVRAAEAADYAGAIHRLHRALALLELSCGDPAAAWRELATHLSESREMDDYLAQLAGSVGIEVLIARGELGEAERLLARLEHHAAQADAPVAPLAARCRGLLLAAHGDDEGAVASLEAAAADVEPPCEANPFELARTLHALGTVQRRAQHKRAARETLQRAIGMFESLGARIWLEDARSELRRIGGRIPVGGELSETERRIVELVVAGRRNREVAAELSLSPNTVAWNLSKVYRKLGVRSRTELAAHTGASAPT